jgi:hypothetical protein
MATAQTSSTETLFHQWRKGDAVAGQAMAQRFTDWYFAIAATRLGEDDGDPAFREACTQFSRGVGKVGDARRLLGWAHSIARKQIQEIVPTGRLADGNTPNGFTRKQPPKELLVRVREQLPDEMALLETAYRGQPVHDPQDLLLARYAVKAWMRHAWEIPFRVAPERPDPDRAPLPFYEAGRMTEEEETHFELYMLHDMEVCQDVAEFAHFAIALRGGLPGATPEVRVRAPKPPPAPAPAPVRAGAVAPQSAPAPAASPAQPPRERPQALVRSGGEPPQVVRSPEPAAPLPGYVKIAGLAAVGLLALFVILYATRG